MIIAVYNAKKDLEDTIKNVLSVDANIQLIVIDGGSNDGTLEVVKKYHQNLKYWVSEPDKGIYDAMNKGWEQADINSHILFLGAGDKIVSLPNVEHVNQILFGDVAIGVDDTFNSRVNWRTKLHNTIHHQALLIPKQIHSAPPFNLRYKVYADFDFNQRLLLSNKVFKYSNSLIGYAKPDGVSSKIHFMENIQIVHKNYGFLHAILSALICSLSYIKQLILNRHK